MRRNNNICTHKAGSSVDNSTMNIVGILQQAILRDDGVAYPLA